MENEDKGKRVTDRPYNYESLDSNATASLRVYGGSIANYSVELNATGKDVTVFLNGTVEQIVKYAIGEEVLIGEETFMREVPRSEKEAVDRIKRELNPEAQGGARVEGYKYTVNEEVVTPDSFVNKYFLTEDKETTGPLQKKLFGVNVVVSAIVTLGRGLEDICRWQK